MPLKNLPNFWPSGRDIWTCSWCQTQTHISTRHKWVKTPITKRSVTETNLGLSKWGEKQPPRYPVSRRALWSANSSLPAKMFEERWTRVPPRCIVEWFIAAKSIDISSCTLQIMTDLLFLHGCRRFHRKHKIWCFTTCTQKLTTGKTWEVPSALYVYWGNCIILNDKNLFFVKWLCSLENINKEYLAIPSIAQVPTPSLHR